MKLPEERVFFGKAPTLAQVKKEYGASISETWLETQLVNLSEYCGVKDKLTISQLQELASLMAAEYYYLKISELMCFFGRFKMGKYGQFYGNVDPLKITSALLMFLEERADVYERREREERKKQREEDWSQPRGYEAYKIMLERKRQQTT